MLKPIDHRLAEGADDLGHDDETQRDSCGHVDHGQQAVDQVRSVAENLVDVEIESHVKPP